MKILVWSLLSLLVGVAQASDKTCAVITPKGSGISERTRSITMPDGKTITIVGQNHGDRLDLRSIMDQISMKSETNSNWQWFLQSKLDNNKRAIQDASEEVPYLTEMLSKNPDIKYIGIEADPSTAPDHIKYSKKVQDDLLSEVSRRKITDMKTNPLVLGFAGSAVYLKMTNPGLTKNKTYVGLESQEASKLHGEALDKYNAALDKLKAQIDYGSLEGQALGEKIDQTPGQFFSIYPNYNANMDDKIMASALKNTPEKYKQSMKTWISSSLDEMKAMRKRDEAIAKNLNSLDASVVSTIGLAHLDSVMSYLSDTCKKSSGAIKLSSPSSSKKAIQ